MDYQNIMLVATIIFNTICQIVAMIKGNGTSVAKLEKQRQKTINLIAKKEEKAKKLINQIDTIKKEQEINGNSNQ